VNTLTSPARRRRRTAIDAALLIVVVLLIVQMWLLTATLESSLAGHDVALAGLLTSLVLFLACFAIYRLVVRLDRAPEPEEGPTPSASGPWQI